MALSLIDDKDRFYTCIYDNDSFRGLTLRLPSKDITDQNLVDDLFKPLLAHSTAPASISESNVSQIGHTIYFDPSPADLAGLKPTEYREVKFKSYITGNRAKIFRVLANRYSDDHVTSAVMQAFLDAAFSGSGHVLFDTRIINR